MSSSGKLKEMTEKIEQLEKELKVQRRLCAGYEAAADEARSNMTAAERSAAALNAATSGSMQSRLDDANSTMEAMRTRQQALEAENSDLKFKIEMQACGGRVEGMRRGVRRGVRCGVGGVGGVGVDVVWVWFGVVYIGPVI